jgi:hypothetical protein
MEKTTVLVDKACYERGCACHDPRVDTESVEMIRRTYDDDDTMVYRNELLEEVAKRIECYKFPFGTDTVASFAALVREMKR